MPRCAALLAATLACAAAAEPGADDYRSTQPAVPTAAERRRLAERLEAERRREAEREAARLTAAAAEAARREAEQAARPPGERLVEARCSACHAPAVLDLALRGRLGWRLTVERMRWWHGAPLEPGEAALISAHLALSRPAGGMRLALEAGLGAATLAAFVATAAWFAGHRGGRRRRRHDRHGKNQPMERPR